MVTRRCLWALMRALMCAVGGARAHARRLSMCASCMPWASFLFLGAKATLSSFKNVEGVRVGLDPEQDARVVGAWSRRLGSILQESQVEPFVIRASKLELSPGAAIVHFEDPTGTIERIRDRVRTALAGDPSLEALDLEFGGKVAASIHVPNIIHSSYARFVATVSPEEFSAMEAAFNALSARFKPFDILVDRITLANESSPYMHQRRDEHGEFSTWALPCGSEGTGGNKGTSSGQEEDPDKKQPRDGDQEVSASLK